MRYALERFLYRLGVSPQAGRFILKGALLFTLWYDLLHWPTCDVDRLGFGPSELDALAATFGEVAAVAVEEGLVFDPGSVSVEEIPQGGRLRRRLGPPRCHAGPCPSQGAGCRWTSAPVPAVYPVLLDDFPAPRLRTYPVYTVVVEKLHWCCHCSRTAQQWYEDGYGKRFARPLDRTPRPARIQLEITLLHAAMLTVIHPAGRSLGLAIVSTVMR